jgi:F-type H+-transporting ATPase subunit b
MALLHNPEFWVLVAGVIFVAVVWKPAKRAIVGSLDERAQRIRSELDEAERLRREAETLLEDYRRRRQAAQQEAAAIVAQARDEAAHLAERARRELDQTLERRRRLAEERIAQAEAKAAEEIRALAVDLAIAASRQLLAAEIDAASGARLIDAAIAELPRGLQ